MRIDSLRPILLPVLIAFGALASTHAGAQHVHGVIELGIVVEGSTVAVSLSAPMSDVVGFEHAPETDEQKQRIQQAAAVLSDANEVIGLIDAANCTTSDASVEGPAFLMKYVEDEASAASDHGEHDHDAHDSHEDEHHHDEEEHSEINANYEWSCGDVSKLDSLALLFTARFASVETIDIQVLTSAGARVLTAEGRAASVSLSPP